MRAGNPQIHRDCPSRPNSTVAATGGTRQPPPCGLVVEVELGLDGVLHVLAVVVGWAFVALGLASADS